MNVEPLREIMIPAMNFGGFSLPANNYHNYYKKSNIVTLYATTEGRVGVISCTVAHQRRIWNRIIAVAKQCRSDDRQITTLRQFSRKSFRFIPSLSSSIFYDAVFLNRWLSCTLHI